MGWNWDKLQNHKPDEINVEAANKYIAQMDEDIKNRTLEYNELQTWLEPLHKAIQDDLQRQQKQNNLDQEFIPTVTPQMYAQYSAMREQQVQLGVQILQLKRQRRFEELPPEMTRSNSGRVTFMVGEDEVSLPESFVNRVISLQQDNPGQLHAELQVLNESADPADQAKLKAIAQLMGQSFTTSLEEDENPLDKFYNKDEVIIRNGKVYMSPGDLQNADKVAKFGSIGPVEGTTRSGSPLTPATPEKRLTGDNLAIDTIKSIMQDTSMNARRLVSSVSNKLRAGRAQDLNMKGYL